MRIKRYETVFILKPTLDKSEYDKRFASYIQLIKKQEGKIITKEEWGLRSMEYSIQKHKKGAYFLVEFDAPTTIIDLLETTYRRDEHVLRFLTTSLDKDGIAYSEARKKRLKKEKSSQQKKGEKRATKSAENPSKETPQKTDVPKTVEKEAAEETKPATTETAEKKASAPQEEATTTKTE